MKHFSLLFVLGLLSPVLLAGCGGGGGGGGTKLPGSPYIYTRAEAEQPAKWTVLIYLDADNDLEDAAILNFNQMESVGSTRDVHVIVQMDRIPAYDSSNGDWTDTRRYLIVHDTSGSAMHSVRLDEVPLGELDMANPGTLMDFVQWGKSQFPADHYALIVWDHGSGWQMQTLRARPRHKSIVFDDTSVSEMSVTQIPAALASHVDVLAFDACYMQQLEVAYEVRGCADYLVGSTATEPSPGYDYARVLSHITASTTPAGLCQMIVQQYAAEYPNPQTDITQSAIDLSRISEVAAAASDLAAILEANAFRCRKTLAAARRDSLNYCTDPPDYYSHDLLDYSSRCATAVGPDASAAYSDLQSAVSAALVASWHNSDMPNAHGLAIYAPPPGFYSTRYGELSLSRDTQWDNWLQSQFE